MRCTVIQPIILLSPEHQSSVNRFLIRQHLVLLLNLLQPRHQGDSSCFSNGSLRRSQIPKITFMSNQFFLLGGGLNPFASNSSTCLNTHNSSARAARLADLLNELVVHHDCHQVHCKLATHGVAHGYILCCFYAQTSKPPP